MIVGFVASPIERHLSSTISTNLNKTTNSWAIPRIETVNKLHKPLQRSNNQLINKADNAQLIYAYFCSITCRLVRTSFKGPLFANLVSRGVKYLRDGTLTPWVLFHWVNRMLYMYYTMSTFGRRAGPNFHGVHSTVPLQTPKY